MSDWILKKVLLIVLTLSSLASPAVHAITGYERQQAKEFYEQALDAENSGDYFSAADVYDHAYRLFPNENIKFNYFRSLYLDKQYNKVFDEGQSYLETNPPLSAALTNVLRALVKNSEPRVVMYTGAFREAAGGFSSSRSYTPPPPPPLLQVSRAQVHEFEGASQSSQPARTGAPMLMGAGGNTRVSNCPTASPPRQLTTPMLSNGVVFNSHCFYLANGRESCTSACRRLKPGGTCDVTGLRLAARSVDQCKHVVASLGGPGGLDHAKSGQYPDDDAGCTYGDWGLPENRWVQVMKRSSSGPSCDTVNQDASRMRVCACN